MSGRGIRELITGNKKGKLKGTVVVTRKSVLGLDVTSISASVIDGVGEFLGRDVTCQLISSTVVDPNNGNRGKVCATASLQAPWLTKLPCLTSSESKFRVTFDWEVEKHGVPGAVIVRNNHASEFFLRTITLDDVPGRGTIVFVANSWVYPQCKYHYSRIFFTNDTYLPDQMPEALKPYRDDELRILRGDDQQGPYKAHERVYRYDVYNDIGNPDRGNPRPTLGGSKEFPYPRRCRTGRKPTKTDPSCESTLTPLVDGDIYVPRDELFGQIKKTDFYGFVIKSFGTSIFDVSPGEFDSFNDIIRLYEGGIKLPKIQALEELRKQIPFHLIKDILPAGGDYLLKHPVPQIIKEDKKAWMTDEEFARETLAGVNPMIIKRLTVFPPRSNLDPSKYGDHTSTIMEAHIEDKLEGLTVQQALDGNRLYILDHHDNFMPFLVNINNIEGNFIYAARTLLFLRGDGTLAPLAIELSLPELRDGVTAAKNAVYTPTATTGAEAWVWHLAKAYANVNDYCWHQLISHWLNTHAVMEPFIIATNRQLSVTHPVHKLLQPHYRDTMNINSSARQLLVNAGGFFERTVFPRQYAFEISSKVYGSWNFTEQALPDDLIKRGMAVPDPSSPYKVRLLIEDYPYASDGLAVWHAIEQWVTEYLAIYYPNDGVLQADVELQAWWKEAREVGHADLKDEPWWPEMHTTAELAKACATIVWIASALHAAVNFGQYPYAGYLPNRPSISRRPMPVPGTKEYEELECTPEKVFLRTITSQLHALAGISLLEVLSSHSDDEVYLGQRDTPEWTSDARAQEAFRRFGVRLTEIESRVVAMNADPRLKNRSGPAKVPYMLLYPSTSDKKGDSTGITGKGIPNSISI